MAKAVKEAMSYYATDGLTHKAVIVFQVAGTIFLSVIYFAKSLAAKLSGFTAL